MRSSWYGVLVNMCTADVMFSASLWDADTLAHSSYLFELAIGDFQLSAGGGLRLCVEDAGVVPYDP
jgi:hypothetical protein